MTAAGLGPLGVWWSGSWRVAADPVLDAAAELEALGYGAIWSSGGFKSGLSSRFGRLLASTRAVVVASGIVNTWLVDPAALASAVAGLDAAHPGRFLLGLGASHAPLVEGYTRPYTHVAAYLDALDDLVVPVPVARRVLAALGPRMLSLAAARAAGAHPYLVPVEHTARARAVMGPGPLLAPEVTAVLDADPARARRLARQFVSGYLALPNYANNLRALGFDDDLADGGSDRLIDAVVAWGTAEGVVERIRQHHEAGADHVCVQILSPEEGFPMAPYRDLWRAWAGS